MRYHLFLTVVAAGISVGAITIVAQPPAAQITDPPCSGWRVIILDWPESSAGQLPTINVNVQRHLLDAQGNRVPLPDTTTSDNSFPSLPPHSEWTRGPMTYWMDGVSLAGDPLGTLVRPGMANNVKFFDSTTGRWWCAELRITIQNDDCPAVYVTFKECPDESTQLCCESVEVRLIPRLEEMCAPECCCYEVEARQTTMGYCDLSWVGIEFFGTTAWISSHNDTLRAPLEQNRWYSRGTVQVCDYSTPDSLVVDFKDGLGITKCRKTMILENTCDPHGVILGSVILDRSSEALLPENHNAGAQP